jgi:hypothetical protein
MLRRVLSRSIERPLLIACALGCGWLSAAGCASSTVRVPVADGSQEYREVQPLDCRVYDERRKSLTIGLNFSVLFGAAAAGPQATIAESTGVKWDRTVQVIVAQYKELCTRYNAGAVSQASYDVRLGEIDQLYAEAQGIRESADAAIRRHSREAFAALDGETGGGPDRQSDAERVVSGVDALYARTAPAQ